MPLDPLKIAKESLGKAIETEKRNRRLLDSIGPAVIDALRPVFSELKEVISRLKVDVTPKVDVYPEIKMPEIRMPSISIPDIIVPEIIVPEPKVTVNVPPIKVPDIVMPEEMNIKGWVSLMGVDLNNPLPVQLRDASGNPVNLFENLTQIVSGGGGAGFRKVKIDGTVPISAGESLIVQQLSGANWSVTIAGSTGTVGVVTIDPDGNPTYASSTSGLTDAELRATAVPVSQVSGAAWSVSVNDAFRTTVASNLINSDDRLRVSVETGGSGLTDSELRATAVPVSQLSGAIWSTEVKGTVTVDGSGVTQPVSATNLDIRDLANATDLVSAYQISGAVWSVSVNDSFRTTAASNLINSDDRLRVSVETGGSGLTDAELRASSVPVQQVSGSNWSVNIATQPTTFDMKQVSGSVDSVVVNDVLVTVNTNQVSGANFSVNIVTQPTTFDIKQVSGSVDSVVVNSFLTSLEVNQVSGAAWSVSVNDAFRTTVASNLINSDDRLRVSLETGGSGLTDAELRATAVPVSQVSGASWSTNLSTALDLTIDSISAAQVSGANYSVYITGSSGTTVVVGDDLSDAADSGGAPIKIGGIARTANPAAVAAGDRVSNTFDDLGRQIVRPLQVRDLLATAYVSLATGSAFGTETTLIAAAAGFFYDLIYVMATNDSDAAVTADVRGVTAGNTLLSVRIPANGTAGIAMPCPLPQSGVDTGNAWTVDLPDVTGTNVTITALFTKEV